MLECNKSDGREWIVHWRRVWAIKVSQVSLNEFDTQRCHCDKCCRLKEYRVKCPILMIRHNWFTIESSRISTMHSEINTLERSKKQEATMMTLNQQSWATEKREPSPIEQSNVRNAWQIEGKNVSFAAGGQIDECAFLDAGDIWRIV